MFLTSWASSLLQLRRQRTRKGTRRPILLSAELLEERVVLTTSVPAAHVYQLNGTLADQMGGPSLAADGGVLDATRYTFGANQGLRLTGALANTANYSVVLCMEFDSLSPGYKKVLDFSQRSSDQGLYIAGSQLQLYPGTSGAATVSANTDFYMALTRNSVTGETKTYLNGVLQKTYTGSASNAAIASANVLTFFEDDLASRGSEAKPGSVDAIAIYNGVLTAADVDQLFQANVCAIPTTVDTATTVTAANATYDGLAHSATATVGPESPAGTVTFLYTGTGATVYNSAAAPTNAGTYHVVASFTPNDLVAYKPSSAETDFSIDRAAISDTIGDTAHVYGSTVDLASALGTTINTGVNGENLAIAYSSTGNTVLANAGSYAITGVVSDGSGLAANYTMTLSPGALTVTRATLTGNATTQGSLNLSKQGSLSINVSNVAGLLNGDTLAAVLSTAQYFITVGTNQYVFVPATVTTFGGSITISYTLKNSALATQLAAELVASPSGAVRAGLRFGSLNYTFIDDDVIRLFSTVKPSPAVGKRPLLN